MPPPPPPKKQKKPKKPDPPPADVPQVAELAEPEPPKKRSRAKKQEEPNENSDKTKKDEKKEEETKQEKRAKKKTPPKTEEELPEEKKTKKTPPKTGEELPEEKKTKKTPPKTGEELPEEKKTKKTPPKTGEELPEEKKTKKTPKPPASKASPKPKVKPDGDKGKGGVLEPAPVIPKDFVATPYNPEPNRYVAPDFPICWGNHHRIMLHYGVSAKEATDILIAVAGPHPNASVFEEKFNGITGNPAFDEIPEPLTRKERELIEDSQLSEEDLDGESLDLGDLGLNGPYDDGDDEKQSVADTTADSSTHGSRVDQLETQPMQETQETHPSDIKNVPSLSTRVVQQQPTPLKNEAYGSQKMFQHIVHYPYSDQKILFNMLFEVRVHHISNYPGS